MKIAALNRLLKEWSPLIVVRSRTDPTVTFSGKLKYVYRNSDGRLTLRIEMAGEENYWSFFTQHQVGSDAWDHMHEDMGGIGDMVFSQRESAYAIVGLNHDTIH